MTRKRYTTDQVEAHYREHPGQPPAKVPWQLIAVCVLGAILIVIGIVATI